MSRDRQAKVLAERLKITYTEALSLGRIDRRQRADDPHPLDCFAPVPITEDWVAEVADFAAQLERFIGQIRRAHPDEEISTLLVVRALEDELLDDSVNTKWLTAVNDHFTRCAWLNHDLWWNDISPDADLVEPFRERLNQIPSSRVCSGGFAGDVR